MSDIPDGPDAAPWTDGFHAAERIYQNSIASMEAQNRRILATHDEIIRVIKVLYSLLHESPSAFPNGIAVARVREIVAALEAVNGVGVVLTPVEAKLVSEHLVPHNTFYSVEKKRILDRVRAKLQSAC